MPSFSENLGQTLQRARTLARKRHAASTSPEHLLLALTDDPDAGEVMRGCKVDLDSLRQAVAASLPAAPLGAAADADPPPDASFRKIIQHATIHVQSVDLDTVTGAHVLVEMLTDPVAGFLQQHGMTRYDAVSYLSDNVSAWIGSPTNRTSEQRPVFSRNLGQTLQSARTLARDRNAASTTPDQLLLALTDDPDAVAVMRGCDVDIDGLRRAVSSSLAIVQKDPRVAAAIDPPTSMGFDEIVQRAAAHCQSSGLNEVTGAHVLVAAFGNPAAALLEQHGLTRYRATSYICHGSIASPAPAVTDQGDAAEARYEVVLLNDSYTPMEFVVWVLEEIFEFPRDDATTIMLATHEKGVGSCGIYRRAEAERLAKDVMDRARKHQHPLRCALRAAAPRSA